MGITLTSGDLGVFLSNLNAGANRKEGAREFDISEGLANARQDIFRRQQNLEEQKFTQQRANDLFDQARKLHSEELIDQDHKTLRDFQEAQTAGVKLDNDTKKLAIKAAYRTDMRSFAQNYQAAKDAGLDPSQNPVIMDQLHFLTSHALENAPELGKHGPEKTAASILQLVDAMNIVTGVAGEVGARKTAATLGTQTAPLSADQRASLSGATDTMLRGVGASPETRSQAAMDTTAGLPASAFGQNIKNPINVQAARGARIQNDVNEAVAARGAEDLKRTDATKATVSRLLAGGRDPRDVGLSAYADAADQLVASDPTLDQKNAILRVHDEDVQTTLSQPETVAAFAANGFPASTAQWSPEQYQIASRVIANSRQADEAQSTYLPGGDKNTFGTSISSEAVKAGLQGLAAGNDEGLFSKLYNNKTARTLRALLDRGAGPLLSTPSRQKTGVVNP